MANRTRKVAPKKPATLKDTVRELFYDKANASAYHRGSPMACAFWKAVS